MRLLVLGATGRTGRDCWPRRSTMVTRSRLWFAIPPASWCGTRALPAARHGCLAGECDHGAFEGFVATQRPRTRVECVGIARATPGVARSLTRGC
jgi:hypothetical protein